MVIFLFDPTHSSICRMVKINRPSPPPIKFELFHIIYGREYPLILLFSAQYLIPLRISSVGQFQSKCRTISIAVCPVFSNKHRHNSQTNDIDLYHNHIPANGCPWWLSSGVDVGLHEKLEAKDKFSRTLKVCLFLSIHSNRTTPLFEQHNRRPPNPPAAHALAAEAKNRSISVAHEDLGPSILAGPTIKKTILSQNFTKISKTTSRSEFSTSDDDVNLSINIITMSDDRIAAVYNVRRVLLGCRRCSIPAPKKAEWRV